MSETSGALRSKIRSRGHWQVIVRPTRFVVNRVREINSLFPLIQKSSVQLRGWDFPHIDDHTRPHIDIDWVGQEFEWEHYLEAWRIYQSAQFVHISGIWDDWRDQSNFWFEPLSPNWQPGSSLGFTSTIWRYTEIYEFVSRLVSTEAYAEVDRVFVAIKLVGLQGRKLYVDDPKRTSFYRDYQATLREFPYEEEYLRQDLIAKPREFARKPVGELLQRFGYDPPVVLLEGVQEELYRNPFSTR